MKSKRFFASLAIAAGLIGAAAHAADDFPVKPVQAVSYTHLTLPTN